MEASGARPLGQGQQRTSRRLLDVSKADYTSGSLVHLPGKDKRLQQRPAQCPLGVFGSWSPSRYVGAAYGVCV